MPGSHLNDNERSLKKMWEKSIFKHALTGIEIEGENGLRGIKTAKIEFRYPLTVICGKNGAGKSTILALAALAYHGIEDFSPNGVRKKSKAKKPSHYTFGDFFYRMPIEPKYGDIRIKWSYVDSTPLEFHKQSEKKWMHYERRCPKAVHFIGLSRAGKVARRKSTRNKFNEDMRITKECRLEAEFLDYLNEIFDTNRYESASRIDSGEQSLGQYKTDTAVLTSFNMGTGEDIVIKLFSILQQMPRNSLCVIDEIEMGIHPSALRKLAAVLIEISRKRHIQFIISSHSYDFIDSVPRQARILLERNNEKLYTTYSPTTRYAIGNIAELPNQEMAIYCEDKVASRIIKASLPPDIRKRIMIFPVGGKTQLPDAYVFHLQTRPNMKALIVWDGDVREAEIKRYIEKIHNRCRDLKIACADGVPIYQRLPGNTAPEFMLVQGINGNESAKKDFSRDLGYDETERFESFWKTIVKCNNPHSILYAIHEETQLSDVEIVDHMIRGIKKYLPNFMSEIKDTVIKILNDMR